MRRWCLRNVAKADVSLCGWSVVQANNEIPGKYEHASVTWLIRLHIVKVNADLLESGDEYRRGLCVAVVLDCYSAFAATKFVGSASSRTALS
jgi:hypothetical protein